MIVLRAQPKYEIVTEHNVKIWEALDEYKNHPATKWYITSDEHPTGTVYHGCDDFPYDKVIWVGYIAEWARWEERGECKSIRRADLEFHWLRDEHHNVRRIQ